MTPHFTFFESYYSSVKDLDNDLKAEFFDALFQYALYNIEPNSDTNPVVVALFSMAKPNLDSSKQRREAGKQGGSKAKQTVSKAKQVPSDKEKEKEKEKDIKPFTFSLSASKLLSSTSKEYKYKLETYIKSARKKLTYQDFYNQCEMKPYKYKNFKMAYDSWTKDEINNFIPIKQNPSLGGYN